MNKYPSAMPRSLIHARRLLIALFLIGVFVAPTQAVEDPYETLRLLKAEKLVQAKPFAVPAAARGTVRLRDLRGKVVMVNFWATWCPPCKEEMPAIQSLYDRFKSRGFSVVVLSVDHEGQEVVLRFVQEQKLTVLIGLDPKMEVAAAYGVRGLPATFLIDKEGRLVTMALGPREWDSPAARALIESLLNGSKR
ncbi:MAG TPA: redoxin domain-containing protein [Methylomirabilota bacterium]|nr:redoxin domain-containing protein [Methylomirabilota bacterium]